VTCLTMHTEKIRMVVIFTGYSPNVLIVPLAYARDTMLVSIPMVVFNIDVPRVSLPDRCLNLLESVRATAAVLPPQHW